MLEDISSDEDNDLDLTQSDTGYDSDGSHLNNVRNHYPNQLFSQFTFPIFNSTHKENYFAYAHSKISHLISTFEDLDYRLNMPLVNYWSGLHIEDDTEDTLWPTVDYLETKLELYNSEMLVKGRENVDLKRLSNHLFVRRYTMLTLERLHRIEQRRWRVEHNHPPRHVPDFFNYQKFSAGMILRMRDPKDPVPMWRPGQEELKKRNEDFVVQNI
jgi:hypothetical protein